MANYSISSISLLAIIIGIIVAKTTAVNAVKLPQQLRQQQKQDTIPSQKQRMLSDDSWKCSSKPLKVRSFARIISHGLNLVISYRILCSVHIILTHTLEPYHMIISYIINTIQNNTTPNIINSI